MTPAARTPDEHPLSEDDWRLCAGIFSGFRHVEVEFLTLFFMPLNLILPRSWGKALAGRLRTADDRLLRRFPSLRKHARLTFLILE